MINESNCGFDWLRYLSVKHSWAVCVSTRGQAQIFVCHIGSVCNSGMVKHCPTDKISPNLRLI